MDGSASLSSLRSAARNWFHSSTACSFGLAPETISEASHARIRSWALRRSFLFVSSRRSWSQLPAALRLLDPERVALNIEQAGESVRVEAAPACRKLGQLDAVVVVIGRHLRHPGDDLVAGAVGQRDGGRRSVRLTDDRQGAAERTTGSRVTRGLHGSRRCCPLDQRRDVSATCSSRSARCC